MKLQTKNDVLHLGRLLAIEPVVRHLSLVVRDPEAVAAIDKAHELLREAIRALDKSTDLEADHA